MFSCLFNNLRSPFPRLWDIYLTNEVIEIIARVPSRSLLFWVLENPTCSSGPFTSPLRFMVTKKHSYQKVIKVIQLFLKQCIQKGVTSVWHSGGWQTGVTLLTDLTPERWKDQYLHVPVSLLGQAHRMESFYHLPLRKFLNPDALKLYGLDRCLILVHMFPPQTCIHLICSHTCHGLR